MLAALFFRSSAGSWEELGGVGGSWEEQPGFLIIMAPIIKFAKDCKDREDKEQA